MLPIMTMAWSQIISDQGMDVIDSNHELDINDLVSGKFDLP